MSAPANTGVQSASYLPCEHCAEGSLSWDPTEQASVCVACGESTGGEE
ncbi:hypothetical protein [Haloglomus salinum]|jgi:uncharacterized protein (DUF983 family)|nr:hypothetical protein [Haloglomus salinum]